MRVTYVNSSDTGQGNVPVGIDQEEYQPNRFSRRQDEYFRRRDGEAETNGELGRRDRNRKFSVGLHQ